MVRVLHEVGKESPELERKTENIKSDRGTVGFLLILYTIQSVPKGFSDAVALLLQSHGASYTDQAIFNLINTPFIFKILWAPLVDSVYSVRFGKRKTWVIPSQFGVGFCLLFLYFNIEDWLSNENGTGRPKIVPLTLTFFVCNLLRATHDIALDGWAVTLFQRENVGHAGTCNIIGLMVGITIGYTAFTASNSKEFCNTWLREPPESTGIVSASDFSLFWSIIYIVSTFWIWIFKKDRSLDIKGENNQSQLNPGKSFIALRDLLKIKPMRSFCITILASLGLFAPSTGITWLKLIDAGVTREKLVLISLPLIPLHAILPFLLKRYLVGARSMNYLPSILKLWLGLSLLIPLFVCTTPLAKTEGTFPLYYYGLLFLVVGLEKTVVFAAILCFQAFFARISDPFFGGTYTTFLYAVANIGKDGLVNISLWLVDLITWKHCKNEGFIPNILVSESNQECSMTVDGYYIEIILASLFGYFWLHCGGTEKIQRLADIEETSWRIIRKTKHSPETVPLDY